MELDEEEEDEEEPDPFPFLKGAREIFDAAGAGAVLIMVGSVQAVCRAPR
jgi:hypothetical protein